MNMKTSKKGLDFIKDFESYMIKLPNGDCKAYWDATGKVWTIGWGCTEGVNRGDVWTREHAEKRFAEEMAEHEGYVNDYCQRYNFVPNQNQFDALSSFCYNCGPRNLNLLFKNGFKFERFVRSGGIVLRGLIRRRNGEKKMFNTPMTKEENEEAMQKAVSLDDSRQLKVGKRFQRFLEWSGISTLLSFATFEQVKDYLLDPRTAVILVLGFLAWAVIKYVNFRTEQAFEEGRYTPRELIDVNS